MYSFEKLLNVFLNFDRNKETFGFALNSPEHEDGLVILHVLFALHHVDPFVSQLLLVHTTYDTQSRQPEVHAYDFEYFRGGESKHSESNHNQVD